MAATTIGILALQGAFDAHSKSFHEVGLKTREVRRVADLEGLGALMIPGNYIPCPKYHPPRAV